MEPYDELVDRTAHLLDAQRTLMDALSVAKGLAEAVQEISSDLAAWNDEGQYQFSLHTQRAAMEEAAVRLGIDQDDYTLGVYRDLFEEAIDRKVSHQARNN